MQGVGAIGRVSAIVTKPVLSDLGSHGLVEGIGVVGGQEPDDHLRVDEGILLLLVLVCVIAVL